MNPGCFNVAWLTHDQIQTIIGALKDRVVELIQDLNGNHVIQKCLNRLSPEDAQVSCCYPSIINVGF